MKPIEQTEQEVWFKFFIEITPDATLVVDERGTICMVNSLASKLFGYSQDEIIGNAVEMLVPENIRAKHPKLREDFISEFAVRLMQSSVDLMAQTKSGELLPVTIGLSPMETSDDGHYIMASIRDNTVLHEAHVELIKTKERLRKSEEYFMAVIDQLPAAIALKNNNGQYTLANRTFHDWYAKKNQNIVGLQSHDIYPKHDADNITKIDARIRQTGLSTSQEIVEPFADGSDHTLLMTKFSIQDTDGNKIVGSVETDITELKIAEENLRLGGERLDLALKGGDMGLWDVQFVIRETIVNERYLEMLGYTSDEIDDVDRLWRESIHEEDQDRVFSLGSEYRAGNLDAYEIEYRVMTKSNEVRWLASKGATVERDTQGLPVRMVGIVRDITDRKHTENQMSNAFNIISSSINYAARIQRSVLPDGSLFSSLFSDHFVLWEPRDVVGGDIYWSRIWGDGFLVILGDCTGHGVPGAFMTLIATGCLDNALSDIPFGQVGLLMQRLHQLVQITLGQNKDGAEPDDGMELGICYLGADMNSMTFVGSRFDLYLVENKTVSTIKGTKSGIGYKGIPHQQEYEEHHINNLSSKAFYMITDGFIDQVGGERSRMFGKNRLRELLLSLQDQQMNIQKDIIHQSLIDYQGEQMRRDDVAMIGFKV